MSSKTRYYPNEEIDIEKVIQDKIREEVLEKDSILKEKIKNQQIQDINLSVLEEMTEILSKEEIEEIAKNVRDKYENKKEEQTESWYDKNYQVVNALIVTSVIGSFFILIFLLTFPFLKALKILLALASVGFPFLVVLFGLCYFFGGLFKKG